MKKNNLILLAAGVLTILQSCSTSKANAQTPQKKDPLSIEASMIRALEWQEAHPIFSLAPTDWTNGAYYVGVSKAHETTNNPIFLAALKTAGYTNQWKPLYRTFHADDVAISYMYLYANTTRRDLVDLAPTKEFLDIHLFEPNAWKDGTDKAKEKKILWWWCDALFMAPPVIASYVEQTGEKKYLDAMHKYFMETYNLLWDKEEKLFARDTRYQWGVNEKDLKEPNGKKIFWARGNGWVLGGLALLIEDLPQDFEHRAFYVNLYKELAGRIKGLQQEDGLWRTSLLSPESFDHGEVSASGFYTFGLAWGVNNGLLDKATYTPAIHKAWNALVACQKENGMVGWVQDIGADPQPASADSWQNYGTGAFLLAGSEVIKLQK